MWSLAVLGVVRPSTAALSYRTSTRRASLGRDLKASASYPTFAGKSPVALLANRTLRSEAAEGLRKFRAQGQRDFKTMPQAGPWEYEAKPYITLAEPRLISVYFAISKYMGGAHGGLDYAPYTFGMFEGRVRALKLRDLFRGGDRDAQALSPLLITKLKAGERASSVKSGEVKTIDMAKVYWSLSRTGITFLFPPYVLGSYAEGPHEVKVRFSELKGRLDPQGPLKGLL